MAKYDKRLDLAFAALADPTRREILVRLSRGPATISELAAPHDMALPSFLSHVRKLEDADLIVTRKAGRVRHCRLAEDAFLPVEDWLSAQKDLWSKRLDQFDAYVTALAKDKQA